MIKILNCIIFAGMVAVNIWASVNGINGNKTGDISSIYPTLFTPAEFTFSIWYIIYLALAAFCIFQFKAPGEYIKAINIFFIVSSLLNIAWLFVWHHLLIGISVVVMMALVVTLIIIYRRIQPITLPKMDNWVLKVPFSIYLGWTSVALMSNIAIFLTSTGFNPYPEFLTIIFISATLIVALVMLGVKSDIFYSSTICWALIGIISKYWQEPAYENIVITSAVGIILIIVSSLVKKPKYFKKP